MSRKNRSDSKGRALPGEKGAPGAGKAPGSPDPSAELLTCERRVGLRRKCASAVLCCLSLGGHRACGNTFLYARALAP